MRISSKIAKLWKPEMSDLEVWIARIGPSREVSMTNIQGEKYLRKTKMLYVTLQNIENTKI